MPLTGQLHIGQKQKKGQKDIADGDYMIQYVCNP